MADIVIKKSQNNSLSDDEIRKLCSGKVNIIEYSKLKDVKNIDQILKPWNACAILYETREGYGHWCGLLKYKIGNRWCLEHFDPYGLNVDEELKFIDPKERKKLNEDYPYLTELMRESGYKIVYGNHRLQEFKNDVSTCGRWVSLRIIFKDKPYEDFVNMFINQKHKPDYYATNWTLFADEKRDYNKVKGGSRMKKGRKKYLVLDVNKIKEGRGCGGCACCGGKIEVDLPNYSANFL